MANVVRLCTVCSSPERKRIERLLAQGTDLGVLEELFSFSVEILRRHRDLHLRNMAVRTPGTDAVVILRDLMRGANQAETVMTWAMEHEKFQLALSAIKAHKENLMAIATITGAARQFDSRVVVPYWEKIKGIILGVAEKHPDIGDDLMEAIGKVEEQR